MLIVFLARYYIIKKETCLFRNIKACTEDCKKRLKHQHFETTLLSNQFDAELLHF